MSDSAFQTFLTGAMLLLVAGVLAIGYLLWRLRDDREDAERAALEGVSQELRLSLQRLLSELITIKESGTYRPGMLMEIIHPQLDAVHSALVYCDRRAISVMGAMYQELSARKHFLRTALKSGDSGEPEYDDALYTAVDGIVTLYLWDEHDGCKPPDARSTRSWDVRKWMIEKGFGQFDFEEMHLRDAVVDRLRSFGMTLTPKPLEFSAYEYWSMRYDRQKDRGVFGARKVKPDPEADHDPEAETEKVDAEKTNKVDAETKDPRRYDDDMDTSRLEELVEDEPDFDLEAKRAQL